MIRKIVPFAVSIVLIGSASLTAYADDILDKDYIVSEIWSDWWQGKGDDGLIFPEASFKHHILTEWVNNNYSDDDYDWSKIGQLNYNFKDYYDELTDKWDFNDDRNGNWTIDTDETTYHFNLQNRKWLMSDKKGDVALLHSRKHRQNSSEWKNPQHRKMKADCCMNPRKQYADFQTEEYFCPFLTVNRISAYCRPCGYLLIRRWFHKWYTATPSYYHS